MLSLEDYESIQETAFLMSSPRNTKRLLESIESLNSGQRIEKRIEDFEEL
jgi:antitoxin YefM